MPGRRQTARIIVQRPSLELLRNQERSWEAVRNVLTAWNEELETRIAPLERDLERLSELDKM